MYHQPRVLCTTLGTGTGTVYNGGGDDEGTVGSSVVS